MSESDVDALTVVLRRGAHNVRGQDESRHEAQAHAIIVSDWLAAHVRAAVEEAVTEVREGIGLRRDWLPLERMPDMQAQASREALLRAADDWQGGQWADAPRCADRIQERIANAQHVTDWLRARADLAALRDPEPVGQAGEVGA